MTTLGLQAEAIARALEVVPLDTTRVQKAAQRVTKQIDRLAQLTGELLDVSRLSGGQMVLQDENVDIVEVIEEAMAEVPNASLAPLPTPRPLTTLRTDRSRLLQVFENILTNASKFGEGKPITVTIADSGATIRISIKDLGIGIAAENHERIFGRFERAVSERNFGGLGLGLWIAWEIVAGLGASIELESSVGAGSTFTVVLPKEKAD